MKLKLSTLDNKEYEAYFDRESKMIIPLANGTLLEPLDHFLTRETNDFTRAALKEGMPMYYIAKTCKAYKKFCYWLIEEEKTTPMEMTQWLLSFCEAIRESEGFKEPEEKLRHYLECISCGEKGFYYNWGEDVGNMGCCKWCLKHNYPDLEKVLS